MLVVQDSEMVQKKKVLSLGILSCGSALKVGKSQSGKSLAKSALLIPSSRCADQTISIWGDDEDEDGVSEGNKDDSDD